MQITINTIDKFEIRLYNLCVCVCVRLLQLHDLFPGCLQQ